jgi:hypothetical protein
VCAQGEADVADEEVGVARRMVSAWEASPGCGGSA